MLEEELSNAQIGVLVQRQTPVVRVQLVNTSGNRERDLSHVGTSAHRRSAAGVERE